MRGRSSGHADESGQLATLTKLDQGKSGEKVVNTICKLCQSGCGMKAYLKDGKLTNVTPSEDHFVGKTHCVKAHPQAVLEYEYSPDRLTDPLRKVNGQWKKVAWDEAFDFIASELGRIKGEWGAKALAFHTGNAFIGTLTEKVARRFCDVYETPNFTSGASFCFYSRRYGHSLVVNHRGATALPNWRGTKCSIIWGGNPEESFHMAAEGIAHLRERGGKLIVIDPRRTELAKEADIYAQIRPGTDCAMALGLMNVIIQDGLYDADFVRDWTVGFDKLVEHVTQYTPEVVGRITWVPAETIRDIARLYATNKPANISEGVKLDHGINGVQTHRAMAILMAICGNMDVEGGNMYSEGFPTTNLRIPERIPHDNEGIGEEYPIFNMIGRERTAMCIPDAILEEKPYPIRAMIVQGTNPVQIWPNTSRTIEALRKLELLVVVDLFMTETAELAHVVLPCTSFLEGWQMKSYGAMGLPLMTIGEKAIEPIGNSMEDWMILVGIMKKMGYGDYFPWDSTTEIFDYLLKESGHKLGEFIQKPGGLFSAKFRPRKYVWDGFNTPSRKLEIYSAFLEELGQDPLPVFREPAESPVSRPDLAESYPLILTTGAKSRYYTHSQGRNIPFLRKNLPEPFVEINTETAKSLGIMQDEMVAVLSPRGTIKIKARLTEDIHPRVVSVMHGWREANVNYLIDHQARDPISSYATFTASPCRVAKLN
ncbi:MAG TPA: molybdopterin-dependent oxidoreductase [Dehalococcoidia bacterium]|nr:molybdopterin-dependent oxidoreductase [Dehalococcoidia bacterium]